MMEKMRKDSRYRFRYIDKFKQESEESDLEPDSEICCLLLQNVKYPKTRNKLSFADFYSVLNECRRTARASEKNKDTQGKKNPKEMKSTMSLPMNALS